MIKHFSLNDGGRDFVVGDIHGCFTKLSAALADIGFDQSRDRLFSTGDLVDRGSESPEALTWMRERWFNPVRGNHDQMFIDACNFPIDRDWYVANGGIWFFSLIDAEKQELKSEFESLPLLIEVETKDGLVGIVHADFPLADWGDALKNVGSESFNNSCMWSRDRSTHAIDSHVTGIHKIIVGHTPVQDPMVLGNVVYIDTGAVFGRNFTIIQIQ